MAILPSMSWEASPANGRKPLGPEDVQAVAYDVLRHRIILRFEAEAEGITADHVIGELLARIAVP